MPISDNATELDKIADQMERDGINDHADILRHMAGTIRAKAGEVHVLSASQGRAKTLVEIVHAQKDNSQAMTRLANLRIRCSRLGLDIPVDAPLTVRMVDDAFAKVNSPADQRMSAKADLMRAGLLSASGL